MKHSILMLALAATLGLAACDNRPEVIYVPPPAAGPSAPAGPTGASGNTGFDTSKGDAGKPGEGGTGIVMPPPASAPAN